MGIDPILAKKHVDEAARLAAATEEKVQQESAENRRAYERFYNNLALFSGGTVALSVTYLGYLKTLPKPVAHEKFLIASWASLLLCLAASLFYLFFNTHYMHYGRLGEYVENLRKQREIEADELQHLNIVNVRSADEREALEARLRKAAQGYEKDEKWATRRESIYYFVWVWSGRIARVAFLVGLGLLFLFAIKNI